MVLSMWSWAVYAAKCCLQQTSSLQTQFHGNPPDPCSSGFFDGCAHALFKLPSHPKPAPGAFPCQHLDAWLFNGTRSPVWLSGFKTGHRVSAAFPTDREAGISGWYMVSWLILERLPVLLSSFWRRLMGVCRCESTNCSREEAFVRVLGEILKPSRAFGIVSKKF